MFQNTNLFSKHGVIFTHLYFKTQICFLNVVVLLNTFVCETTNLCFKTQICCEHVVTLSHSHICISKHKFAFHNTNLFSKMSHSHICISNHKSVVAVILTFVFQNTNLYFKTQICFLGCSKRNTFVFQNANLCFEIQICNLEMK